MNKKLVSTLFGTSIIFLSACTDTTSGVTVSPNDRLYQQLSEVTSDSEILSYLVKEAKTARVSNIYAVSSAKIASICKTKAAYGCAPFTETRRNGVTRQRGEVYLNADMAGGTGVMNITHEIAHIAASRKGCHGHGETWLQYLMSMAERFEERFPNKLWGRSDPTDSVDRKYERYAAVRSSTC